MNLFKFTLIYKLPKNFDNEVVIERLAQNHTDVLVGFGLAGQIGLAFERHDIELDSAIGQAILDINCVLPEAQLLDVEKSHM